jgi:hypothetical protein
LLGELIIKKISIVSMFLVLLVVLLSACGGGSGLPKEVLDTTW